MMEMAKAVGQLVAVAAGPSSAPSLLSSAACILDISLVRCDHAFCRIADIEELLPRRLVRARRIFRGHTELADEYLSFGDNDTEVDARRDWLRYELLAVLDDHVLE
jgi:hypothetical protein